MEKMNWQAGVIRAGNKLQTTRDIHLDGKIIPTGTIFYAYRYDYNPYNGTRVELILISGFGPNLSVGIEVTPESLEGNYHECRWNVTSSMYLPLDCLQLVE